MPCSGIEAEFQIVGSFMNASQFRVSKDQLVITETALKMQECRKDGGDIRRYQCER